MTGEVVQAGRFERRLCPQCSGLVQYDCESYKLICCSCDYRSDLPAGIPFRMTGLAAVAADQTELRPLSATAKEAKCHACEGDIVFEAQSQINVCPFCATPFATPVGQAAPMSLPDVLLPALISKSTAQSRMAEWLSGRWFAPYALQEAAKSEIHGIYLPFWAFACTLYADYQGQHGSDSIVSYFDGEGIQFGSDTKWSARAGHITERFPYELVAASAAVPQTELSSLERWSFEFLQPYDPVFMDGFAVQRLQVSASQGFERARALMTPVVEAHVRSHIGGDRQKISQLTTAFLDPVCAHVWLPLWICSYQIKGKAFHLVMNATTGKLLGERPFSGWKILLSGGLLIAFLTWMIIKLGIDLSSWALI